MISQIFWAYTYIIYVFYIGKRYVYYTGEGSIAIRWSFDTIDKLGTLYTHLIVIHVYRSKCFDHISHTQSVWFDIVHLICDFERCKRVWFIEETLQQPYEYFLSPVRRRWCLCDVVDLLNAAWNKCYIILNGMTSFCW